MGRLVSYLHARTQLDVAVRYLRQRVEGAVRDATFNAQAKVEELEQLSQLAAANLTIPLQAATHRRIVEAWLVCRAALVGLILPQSRVRSRRKPRHTRNRRARGTGKRKAFPSDSHLRIAANGGYTRAKGHRARYRDRWLGTFQKAGGKAKGLPKLARLAATLKGRPEVPPAHRVWRKKVASCKRLLNQRQATADRRYAKGWKQYPRHRKTIIPAKGWSDPSVNRNGALPMRQAVARVRKGNLDVLRERAKRQRRIWEVAH